MGGEVELGKKTLAELQRLKEVLQRAEAHGVDLSAHKGAFRTAVTALKEKDYNTAWSNVEKAGAGFDRSMALACMTRLQVGRRVLQRMKSEGKQSPRAVEIFRSLEPLMREKKFLEVLDRATELEKAIGNLTEEDGAPAREKTPAPKPLPTPSTAPAMEPAPEPKDAPKPKPAPHPQEAPTPAPGGAPAPGEPPAPEEPPAPGEPPATEEPPAPKGPPAPEEAPPPPPEDGAGPGRSPAPTPSAGPQPPQRVQTAQEGGRQHAPAMEPAPGSPPAPGSAPVPGTAQPSRAAEEDRVKELLDAFRTRIDRAVAAGVDGGAHEAAYNDIQGSLVFGDHPKCMELLNKASGELEFAVRNHIVETLTYCYELIQVAPDYLDLSGPKDMYSEANRLYGEEMVHEALEMTARCQSEVDRLKDEHEKLLEQIKGCEKDIETAGERSIDMGEAPRKVSTAKSYFLSGDFGTAQELLGEARGIIDSANEASYKVFREKAWTTILAAENTLCSAREDGLEVAEGQYLLDKARKAFEMATSIDQFPEVYEHIDRLQQNELDAREAARVEKEQKERAAADADAFVSEARRVKEHIMVSELDSTVSLLEDALARGDPAEIAGILAKGREELEKALELSPEIFLKIVGEDLRPDVWSQISLTISNVGKAHARNIRMNFDGPLEVRRIRTVDSLKAGEKKVMEMGVKFNGVGKVPIDIEIIYGRTLDGKQYLFSEETWLEVGAEAGGGRRVTRIGSSYECSYCKQVIEGDDGVVKCQCNMAYHEHCARKSATCPVCKENISNKPPIIRSQKVHHIDDGAAGAGMATGAGPGAGMGAGMSGGAGGAEGSGAPGTLSDDDGTWLD